MKSSNLEFTNVASLNEDVLVLAKLGLSVEDICVVLPGLRSIASFADFSFEHQQPQG